MPNSAYDKASYNSILGRADYSAKLMEGCARNSMCRATLVEVLVRISKFIYCDFVSEKDILEAEALGASHERVNLAKAFRFFIAGKLKQYFLDKQLSRIAFREEKLYDYNVDMVYSMNQGGIKAAHKELALRSPLHQMHSKQETLTLEDCVNLVRNQLNINISS
mmetsp:Transcript_9077/g.11083  ORF Transcript_9077/g.11083 Transcript_9077/m.11083 type:complete len:164 (-) Transcript_9077:333-824(-)